MFIDTLVDRSVYPGAAIAASRQTQPPWVQHMRDSDQPCCFVPRTPAAPSARLYVILHGNMDSFESWRDAKLLPMLSSRLNSDCLLLSYAGYPHCAPTNKTGAARDDEVVRRAVSAVQEAQRHYNNVWLTGHSLGCAVALQCCRHVRPSGLLLVSPFASLRSVAENEYGSMGSWAAGARFDSTQVAKECVRCPVMILHGVNDAVVPPAQSQALFDALPANALKHRFMVPAMQHALAPAHIAVLALRVSQHYPPSRTNAGCTALQFT